MTDWRGMENKYNGKAEFTLCDIIVFALLNIFLGGLIVLQFLKHLAQ